MVEWLFCHDLLTKRNRDILEELLVTPLEAKLCTYRQFLLTRSWNGRLYRLPKQLLIYYPKGTQRPGRPLKRLLDDMNAETKAGHLSPNL
jgi:hypothetical protein